MAAAREDPLWLRLTGRTVGLAIVLGAVAIGIWVQRISYLEPRTDDASVRANLVGIAPHVSGPLVELHVVDNQEVREGELLFVIDPRPYEVALEKARAALLLTRSEVAAIGSAAEAAAAAVDRLEAENAFAADHAARLQRLLPERFVTQDRYEEARVKEHSATAALAGARQELARQRSLLAQFGDVNARLAAAEAAVRGAELDLEYCRVHAPFDARVTNLNISRGKYAVAGEQVFALVDTRAWYVLANYQETYLDAIRPGMAVEVYLLAYPQQRIRGTVQGIGWAIAPADGGDLGVLPDVKPTLNWVRLAQRIPVRILLDPAPPGMPYRMGMTAVVTVRGGEPAAR